MEMEVLMKSDVRKAALVLGFVFFQACGGGPAVNPDRPAPSDGGGRTFADPSGERVAGAVSSLGSQEESGGSFATMVDMLRGRVPGLNISESASGEISVRIRGDQSIYFNKEPLLVVDGMPVPAYSFSSTLRTMNPRDVRSIQVLKDTGSTSSYGTRGAHGVILIRLKRG
jgi:TonB-dependent SusC/RagA subfamily outer membrane receptor